MNGTENPAFTPETHVNVIPREDGFELHRVNGKSLEHGDDTSTHKPENYDSNENIKTGGNWLAQGIVRVREGLRDGAKRHDVAVHRGIIFALHALVFAYVLGATLHWFLNAGGSLGEPVDYCNGVGMVWILVGFIYLLLLYFQVIKPLVGKKIYKAVLKPIGQKFDEYWEYKMVQLGTYAVLIGAIVLFFIFDTATERARLISCVGTITLILLGFIFSRHPGHIKWRPVFWGLGLQFVLALLSIRWPFGRAVLQCVGDKVSSFLAYTDEGSSMVYGDQLVNQWGVFAFKVMPVIFFFSFCIQILYYYGAMQWVVLKLGWLLQVTLGTTVCESVNTAASIFLGQSEAPLLIKPYIPLLTRSELHAIMTGGFATIAGAVMAAYLSFGVDAAHLITASVMSAPAALCYSKLFYPETEKSETTASDIQITKGTETSALDAASKGANDGIQLIMGIIANLIAFVAFIAFVNGAFSWFGSHVGAEWLSFEWLLGQIFIPLAFLMGVQWDECELVATLIGLKTVVNEFVAYEKLGEYVKAGMMSPRSEAIATYALCGFSNPGSIGIMIGSLSTMAPNKRGEIAEVAFRAFLAGCAACFLTACVAGALIDSSTLGPQVTTPEMNYTTTASSIF